MTLQSAIALISAMVVLALLPSLSVMTVLARSASLGFRHGAVTTRRDRRCCPMLKPAASSAKWLAQ